MTLERPPRMEAPRLSVIIPTLDRPGPLAACLAALARSDYPSDRYEVLVVDDGGSSSCASVVEGLADRLAVRLIGRKRGGPAAARNTGAAAANGTYLVFTDDDCVASPGWLTVLAAHLERNPGCAVGGRTMNGLTGNPFAAASQALIDFVYTHYNAQPERARFFAANNMALPAGRFRELGGFDAGFRTSEDRELCDRWINHGYQLVYAPEAVVYHHHHLTFTGFWRQHFNYGRGSYRFRRRVSRRAGRDIRLEPGPFYLDMIRYPLSQIGGLRGLGVALLVAVSQAASGAGFLYQRTRKS